MIINSLPLLWEKIGKGAESPKLGVLNDFIPLWWENIGKGEK